MFYYLEPTIPGIKIKTMKPITNAPLAEEGRTEILMKQYNNDMEDVLLHLYDEISFCEDRKTKKSLIKEYNTLVDHIHDERKRTMYKHL